MWGRVDACNQLSLFKSYGAQGAENDPYKSVSTIVILTYDGKFFYMEKPNWYIIVIVVNIIYLLPLVYATN